MLMKLAPKKQRSPRKWYLGIAAAILIPAYGHYVSFNARQDRENQMEILAATLARENATLPRQLDAVTTFEHVGLHYDGTIIYRYRLDVPASSLSESDRTTTQASLRQALEQRTCAEPQLLKAMRKYKVNQEHVYLARDDKLFTIDISVDSLDCPGAAT